MIASELLIVFFLVEQGRLPAPLLSASSFFERDRAECYDRLQAVHTDGRYQEWVVTARVIAGRLGSSIPGAKNLLELLEQKGIVRSTSVASSRAKRWVAEEVL